MFKVEDSRERFDFRQLLAMVSGMFYAQARRNGIDFQLVINGLVDEWLVGDALRLNQILINLLSNAVKFTDTGGSVRLGVSQTSIRQGTVFIEIVVSDTGIGMSPTFLERLFTPFEQQDALIAQKYGGSGLGMSITKNLVSMMGGAIHVESQEGQGTTFTVELPFLEDAASGEGAPCTGAGHALVACSTRTENEYMALLLQQGRVTCDAVSSQVDAVRAVADAAARGRPYTLCFVDFELFENEDDIRRLRDAAGDAALPCIILAYDGVDVPWATGTAGITHVLLKPVFQSSVRHLLQHLQGKSPASAPRVVHGSLAGVHLLLAEDNDINAEIVMELLAHEGCHVDRAHDGAEAVEIFTSASSGAYAAILMDVQMPIMDGLEAARRIRKSSHAEASTVPILAMTANAFAEDVAMTLAAGMNDHIAKPIDVSLLFATLMRHIPRA